MVTRPQKEKRKYRRMSNAEKVRRMAKRVLDEEGEMVFHDLWQTVMQRLKMPLRSDFFKLTITEEVEFEKQTDNRGRFRIYVRRK